MTPPLPPPHALRLTLVHYDRSALRDGGVLSCGCGEMPVGVVYVCG